MLSSSPSPLSPKINVEEIACQHDTQKHDIGGRGEKV